MRLKHKYYPHLLAPYTIGNVTIKNRVLSMPTSIHALQGGEPWPTEAIILDVSRRAKGGAGVVCAAGALAMDDDAHIFWDLSKRNNQHYMATMAEAIQFYGAIPAFEIGTQVFDYDVVSGLPCIRKRGVLTKQIDYDGMQRIADDYAKTAKMLKYLGYGMCHIHMAYATPNGGTFLSPHYNKRIDEFGGSVENRCRFPNMIFERIKAAAGQDFLIDLRISGAEPQFPDGHTTQDWLEMTKELKNIDILVVHANCKELAHTFSFQGKQPYVPWAEALKKGGCPIPVSAVGGLQDLDEMEEILASGKADFISMARGLIADPDLMNKAYEGKPEDVRPCIHCNKCHDSACRDNKTYVCSVNPLIGLEHRIQHMVDVNPKSKRVAVIGGGPAGMQAALTAKMRGHDVTLFERAEHLGGQLVFADQVDFKAEICKLKNYLIGQVKKANINVVLNYIATPDKIAAQHFDEIIVAIGGVPTVPPIKGYEEPNVFTVTDIFGNEDALKENVIIVGGGQSGCEAALHLASKGKKVTIIHRRKELAPDASILYREAIQEQIAQTPSISVLTESSCTSLGSTVTYIDASGREHTLSCDNVVVAAGTRSLQAEAVNFFGCAKRTQLAGDCQSVGNIQTALRSGMSMALTL